MKQDLATSILTAIVGILVAFFVCNMLLPEIQPVTYKILNSTLTYNLDEPDPEIFNFRAVNPTVEVYVGQCDSYDINGNCMKETETVTDPNQQNQDNSNQQNTTDPNQQTTTDPNQQTTTDPNQQNTTDPNQQTTTDPNQQTQNNNNGGQENGPTN